MSKRIAKVLLGILLVPFCLGFTWQFGVTMASGTYKPETPYFFLAGGLAYLTVHLLFKRPIFTYVIAHELTHALFAMLFGGSVKSLHASQRGGKVTVTKSNFIITLAPYFFPLYTFIAIVLYGAALAAKAGPAAINLLVVLGGAAFTFHLVLTMTFLRTDQSDIIEHGTLFSYPLIYLFNIAFAALLIDIYLVSDMDYLRFLMGGIMKSMNLIMQAMTKASVLIGR